MAAQPGIIQRTEQPYVAIRTPATMQTLGKVVPPLHPEVLGWLRSRGVEAAGQPFIKYNVIDMDRQLEVEVGFPVAAPMTGEGQVLAAVLPAGSRPCGTQATRTGWPARPARCLTGLLTRAWPGTSRPHPMANVGVAAWRFITTNPART
jgi:hypothetical protein